MTLQEALRAGLAGARLASPTKTSPGWVVKYVWGRWYTMNEATGDSFKPCFDPRDYADDWYIVEGWA